MRSSDALMGRSRTNGEGVEKGGRSGRGLETLIAGPPNAKNGKV